jgi:branched-chain amino acid transport system substrate-binding protein
MSLRHYLTVLAAGLFGCARAGSSTDGTIHLGAAGAWETSYGRLSKAGIEMAVAELNAAGGIDGRSIKVTFRDDKNDGATAAAVARSFIDQPEIVGVIGHLTSSAMAAAARVYDGQIAAVSPTATSPDLAGISEWLFRLSPSDSVTGMRLGKFVRNEMQKSRVAVIYENSIYGRGLVEAFLLALGTPPVALEPIDYSTDSIAANIRNIARQRPDVVFAVSNGNSTMPLYEAIRNAGVDVPIISGDGWSAIENETTVSNVLLALPVSMHHGTDAIRAFAAAFSKANNGQAPDAYAALSHDATITLAKAIAGQRSRADIRDALTRSKQQTGTVSGTVTFSAAGDPTGGAMHLVRINNGSVTTAVLQ